MERVWRGRKLGKWDGRCGGEDGAMTNPTPIVAIGIDRTGLPQSAAAMSGRNPVAIFTTEWDDDPREVWEIPEAVDLLLSAYDAAARMGLDVRSDAIRPAGLSIPHSGRDVNAVLLLIKAGDLRWDASEGGLVWTRDDATTEAP